MKKSQLKKIIKETINELEREDSVNQMTVVSQNGRSYTIGKENPLFNQVLRSKDLSVTPIKMPAKIVSGGCCHGSNGGCCNYAADTPFSIGDEFIKVHWKACCSNKFRGACCNW
tara:strand:- start:18 stop:359 length:342 start_codon:yes stop_codon:yes gene_type:complete